jgi:hypothetical protein
MLAPGGVRQAAIRTLIGAYVRFFPEFPNSTPQQSYVGGFSRKGQRRHTGSAYDISGRLPYYLRQLEGPGATWARRASDSLGALFNAHRAALAAWGSRLGCGSCRPRCSPAGCRRHASGAVAQGRARRARHALRTAVVRERATRWRPNRRRFVFGEAGLATHDNLPRPRQTEERRAGIRPADTWEQGRGASRRPTLRSPSRAGPRRDATGTRCQDSARAARQRLSHHAAGSDVAAHLFRSDAARRSDLMSPRVLLKPPSILTVPPIPAERGERGTDCLPGRQ